MPLSPTRLLLCLLLNSAATTLAAEPAPLPDIRSISIGPHRELRVNDKPFFPLASWAQSPTRFPQLRELNFNTFVGGSVRRDSESAHKAGGYFMPNFADAARDNPRLLAYIHGDEPDLGLEKGTPRKPAQTVVDDYRRIRALDPSRPVFVNLTNNFMAGKTTLPEDQVRAYYTTVRDAADILSFDVYPIYGWNRPDKLTWVADGVHQLRQYAGPAKPVFACIETGKGSRWITYERQIDVLPEHTRAEVWMAIIRGATGIIYFTHAWRPAFTEFAPTQAMQSELKRLNAQITRLAPAILAETAKQRVSITLGDGLASDILAKEHEGALYLFAINLDMDRRPATATITVEGLKPGTRIQVLDESRELTAEEGRFRDDFSPLAVHLYRIPQ